MSEADTTIDTIQQVLEAKLEYKSITGSEVNYVCPFCAEDGIPHTLHVNYTKGDEGVALCHGCDYKAGSLLRLIRDLFGGVPRKVALLLRQSVFALDVERILTPEAKADAQRAVALPNGFRRFTRKVTGDFRTMYRWMRKRGLTDDLIDRWGIGYTTDTSSPAYGYVIYPFYTNGVCTYWQGRAVLREKPKMYNPPATDKKSLLFGYDQCPSGSRIAISEGPLDSIAWDFTDHYHGLALTSLYIHEPQIRRIELLEPKRVLVCLDGPKSGMAAGKGGDAYDNTIEIAKTLRRRLACPVGFMLLRNDDPWDNREHLQGFISNRTRLTWMHGEHDVVNYVKWLFEQ